MKNTSLGVVFAVSILFVGCDRSSSPIGPDPTSCGGPANPCVITPPTPTPTVWTNSDTSMHRLLFYDGQPTHLTVRVITASPMPGSIINPTILLPSNGPCLNNSCFAMTAQACVDDVGSNDFKMHLLGYWSADGIRPISISSPPKSFAAATMYTSLAISSGECVDINQDKIVFWPGSRYIIFWVYQGYPLGEEGITANKGGYYILDMDYKTAR